MAKQTPNSGIASMHQLRFYRPDRVPRQRGTDQRSVDVLAIFDDQSLESVFYDMASSEYLLTASSKPVLSSRELLAWTYPPEINFEQLMRALYGWRSTLQGS